MFKNGQSTNENKDLNTIIVKSTVFPKLNKLFKLIIRKKNN
jgi:hypothetical protein